MKDKIEIINIKGQEYQVEFKDYLPNCCGLSDSAKKEIFIENNSNSEELKKRIVHELLHAYFYECGLNVYNSDETLINWIDHHFLELNDKLNKIIEEK